MALLSKKEFAATCGMSTRELAVYIGRGHVVVKKDSQIDDTDLKNLEFRTKYADKKNGTAPPAATKKAAGKKSGTAKTKESAPPAGKPTLLYDLDKEKKALDIETNKKRNELLAMELNKKAGKLIPTSEVKALFAQHSRSIVVSFSQFIDNLLTEITQAYKLNSNQRAELRRKMVIMLNKSVDDSVEMTKSGIENLREQMAIERKEV